MARIARVIIPDCPHHITHRGNHREDIFFTPQDRDLYIAIVREHSRKFDLDILAWCLMSNHIHIVAVPESEIAVAKTIGHAHRKYSRRINETRGWSGHLWANRYFSTPLDEPHLMHAVKYVEQNPVRAGLVSRAEDWAWSSARAHVFGIPDPLLSCPSPFSDPSVTGNWASWLTDVLDCHIIDTLRRNTMTGRPTGSEEFVRKLEERTERVLTPQKRGRKKKGKDDGCEKR